MERFLNGFAHYEDNGKSDHLDFDADEMRPFVEHRPGDRPSVLPFSDEIEDRHERCTIIDKTEDGRYNIILEENEQYMENVD